MKDMSPEKVVQIATGIAISLCKGRSVEELNVIKNIASQVTCSINTIISQQIFLELERKKKND